MTRTTSVSKTLYRVCRRERLIVPGDRILVACSGGPDSLALLYGLDELQERLQIEIGVLCVDHCLRPESHEELEFVQRTAEKLGHPFYGFTENVLVAAADSGESTELAGRRIRYDRLEEVRTREGYSAIAVAHHLDDQAETVLAHLIRGTGLAGLGGMRYRNGYVIRPLLELTKAELAAYLEQKGITAAIDQTNFEPLYQRNQIRLEVLPVLNRLNPKAAESLCRLARLAQEDEDFLTELAKTELQRLTCHQEQNRQADSDSCVLDRYGLRKLPLALRHRVVRQATGYFLAPGRTLTEAQLRQLDTMIAGDGEKHFSAGQVKVWAQYDKIYFVRHDAVISVQHNPIHADSFRRPVITGLRQGEITEQHLPEDISFAVPADSAGDELVVRRRQQGDRIVLTDRKHRLTGHKKLKDYLIDRKIPRVSRDHLWWLARGNTIYGEIRRNRPIIMLTGDRQEYITGKIEEG